MKRKISASLSVAAALGLSLTAMAQTPPQGSTAQQPTSAATSQSGEQVTIVGCVQREADYRKSQDAGRGGVAGTGVGAGNEFVLTNASMASGAPGSTARSEPAGQSPAGTAGTAGAMSAFELTGPNEGQVEQYVGRRVEITGKLKPAETTAAGRPTGGATAGQPPTGVDVASQDLKLRELEVTTVRESSGTCPAR